MQTKLKSRIGLDIGSSAIKLVEISYVSNKPILSAAAVKKATDLSKSDMAEAIRSVVRQAKITSKEVNVSVSGPSVIARFLSMPKMREEELKSAIRFEAEKFIPFDIKDCIVDFQTLKHDEKEKKLNILLVAAKKDRIQERIKLVEDAGLSINIVDVDSFALANAFCMNFPTLSEEKTTAILNIGASSTNLSILRGSIISFVRDSGTGINDFNAAIAKSLGVSPESADELRISPKDRLPDVAACTKQVIGNLLDDIKSSFSYHENQSGRSIDDIYVSGGGANLFCLEEAFQEVFSSKPLVWNPLQFLDITSPELEKDVIDKLKGSFGVVVGLALR